MPQQARQPELELPALRQDLQLCAGPPTLSGTSTWLLHDPVRHRYFQISQGAMDLLRCWQPMGLSAFRDRVLSQFGRDPPEEEVRQIIQFIYANNLSLSAPDGNPLAYANQINSSRQSPVMRVVHGYLFFRIPLVRPERFLRAAMPWVAPLYSRVALVTILALTILGLYLASRQWDAFAATFLALLSIEGALLYGLALAFVKTLHELGHAFTATRYGVRVNTMGVAFMVLMPLLYTDVSDAWRLTSRRKKLMIDAAGLAVELSLAGIATLLWAFLPDGPLRSIAFIVATTSWMLSVFVNLNPFMRFDGYYLLSDAWGIPNLQGRAFALTRWQIREWLFGLAAPPSETFAPSTHRWLVAYAIATWVYRLFLFIGIALIVYHMFFKMLGVTLFIIEIIWFIALPVARECLQWWKLREEIMASKRTYISLGITALLIAIFVIPWRTTIIVPAVSVGHTETRLFPVVTAQLQDVRVRDGQRVSIGDTIVNLNSVELTHKITLAEHRIALLRARLNRIAGDAQELSQRAVLITELEAARQAHAGHLAERKRLTIRAPFAGRIRDLAPNLHPGRYLKSTEAIARIVQTPGVNAQGYITEESLWRVAVGSKGIFIPDNADLPNASAVLQEIAPSGTSNIEVRYLASEHGGLIATEPKPGSGTSTKPRLKPRIGQHFARFTLRGDLPERATRGVIHVTGKAESFAAITWRRILKVLVRESGI